MNLGDTFKRCVVLDICRLQKIEVNILNFSYGRISAVRGAARDPQI